MTISPTSQDPEDDYDCPCIGQHAEIHLRYDTYYCPRCYQWLEPKCGDTTCEVCAYRPSSAAPVET